MSVATTAARRPRSRLTDGRTLLPGIPSQSAWARLFRDMNDAMLSHVGGFDRSTMPQQLTARRIAVLETELRFQEQRIAGIRAEGGEPDDRQLDLYSRISNTQRRHLEALGYGRVPAEVKDIGSYLAGLRATAAPAAQPAGELIEAGPGDPPSAAAERTSAVPAEDGAP